ncbi:hypothetical protein JOD67_007981 [Tenggerimyces flavus]|nr:hypothetical protein [Tenggerimyces flavus]MBM7786117.1 hypothetical protein [Tenggerimyces flavus]MBM7787258.1 hypothetical protein [Tenggerimyces flavus]MBM7787281.1 hypothetical protein [Tenggerimyces flavus]MBM7787679.1 hypothetical protein [Tenggerimyces flavus]
MPRTSLPARKNDHGDGHGHDDDDDHGDGGDVV